MKKILMVGIALSIVFSAAGTALAWHGHSHFGVGVFIRPPLVVPPPLVYQAYPPPFAYYGPHRVWVPGYWDWRPAPRGWHKVRIPGYWTWR